MNRAWFFPALFMWGMFFAIMADTGMPKGKAMVGSCVIAAAWPVVIIYAAFCYQPERVEP